MTVTELSPLQLAERLDPLVLPEPVNKTDVCSVEAVTPALPNELPKLVKLGYVAPFPSVLAETQNPRILQALSAWLCDDKERVLNYRVHKADMVSPEHIDGISTGAERHRQVAIIDYMVQHELVAMGVMGNFSERRVVLDGPTGDRCLPEPLITELCAPIHDSFATEEAIGSDYFIG